MTVIQSLCLALIVGLFVSPGALAQNDGRHSPPPARETSAPHEEEQHAGNLIDELFIGEKLYVQEKNEWYVILEGSYAKAEDEKEYEAAVEGGYGLTDEIQLTIEAPYVFVDPDDGSSHNGIGDVEAAVNWNFVQREDFT